MASITCLALCLYNFDLSTHIIVYPSFLWTYLGLRLTAQEPLGWDLSQQHRGLTQIHQPTLLKQELIQYQMHQTGGKGDIINCCTGKQHRISQKAKKKNPAGDKWTERFSSSLCVHVCVRVCDNPGKGKRETVWNTKCVRLQRSIDLLDDLDKAAIHLIHMDTLTSSSIAYLSWDSVI